MKKTISTCAAAIILILISFHSFAQDVDGYTPVATPKWVSEKGYWVVETNIHQPLQYTVRFYNNENHIVGTQNMNGVKMNINKRKVKMQLKAMLESSLLAWERNNAAPDNRRLATKP